MPRFEVRTTTIYAFNAEDKEAAKRLVEEGEMPSDHELIAVFVSDVDMVMTNTELDEERQRAEDE